MSKKARLYIGLTYLISYAFVGLYLALGGAWTMPGSLIVAVVYMFVPMTVALVLQKVIFHEPVVRPFGISFRWNRWFAVAWLLPSILAFATFGVSLLLPGVEYAPDMAGMFERYKGLIPPEQLRQMESQMRASPVHPIWMALVQGLLAGITINAVAGFGEELGWRGLLLRELAPMGFWKSSLVIGVVWGLWHAPLILRGHNYPQHPQAGVLMMTVWALLLSPIFSYVRLRARSVIAASILHGTLNATYGIAIIVVKGGSDLTVGLTGVAGFVVLGIANAGIYLYERVAAKEPVTVSLAS